MAAPDIPKSSLASMGSTKIAFFVTIILVITMMFDLSAARLYNLIVKDPLSIWRIIAFAVIACICVTCQYLILGFVRRKSTEVKRESKLQLRAVHQVARISHYVITAIITLLVLQTILMSQYYTWLLITLIWTTYGLAVFMLSLLAKRFFSWSMSSKNLVIILYSLASASLSVNAGIILVYVGDILVDRPLETRPYSGGVPVLIPAGSTTAALNSGFFISSVVSFSLLWVATAALLHHHSRKLGTIRYWLIIASPLVLFLSQFASFFIGLFDSMLGSDPVILTLWLTLIFALSQPVGGMLFGIGFFSIARSFSQNTVLRNYLVISALGFVLIFVANQASTLLVTPYPPFGVSSVSFTGLASYLILIGIYSSAISISEDVNLRRTIRRTALEQSKLLQSLGTAQMMQEVQKRVGDVIAENLDKLTEATGLKSLPSEADLKRFAEEVVKEIGKSRDRSREEKGSNNEKQA